MARPYRLQAEGCLYHITSRGNAKKKIFRSDGDFKKFLEYIKKAKERFNFYLEAYVLMPNHYHLLIETTQPNLSRIMHFINASYTTYFNIRNQCVGHLFQGRYKSIIVDKDSYFMELTRYIHLNPVRAGLVQLPQEYPWSSYRAYIGEATEENIDKEAVSGILKISQADYSDFVFKGLEDRRLSVLWDDVYAGFILGPKDFVKQTLASLKEQDLKNTDISFKRGLLSSSDLGNDKILDSIAEVFKCRVEDILKKKNRSFLPRRAAIYLMHILTQCTHRQLASIFGVSYSAISKIIKDFEVVVEKDVELANKVNNLINVLKN